MSSTRPRCHGARIYYWPVQLIIIYCLDPVQRQVRLVCQRHGGPKDNLVDRELRRRVIPSYFGQTYRCNAFSSARTRLSTSPKIGQ